MYCLYSAFLLNVLPFPMLLPDLCAYILMPASLCLRNMPCDWLGGPSVIVPLTLAQFSGTLEPFCLFLEYLLEVVVWEEGASLGSFPLDWVGCWPASRLSSQEGALPCVSVFITGCFLFLGLISFRARVLWRWGFWNSHWKCCPGGSCEDQGK